MKMKKISCCVISILLLSVFLLSGCKNKGPELGKWHAEMKLSNISDSSLSIEDRTLLALLGGKTVFEIDVEFFEDGSFAYEMNTDKLEDAVSNSISTVLEMFIGFDLSLFVDRLVEAAMQDVMEGSKRNYYGKYKVGDDDLIIATDGDELYFRVAYGRLIQLDSDGEEIVKFTKVEA